jgi:nucleotidyltransferase substrate binding protein (TIGR01987 family)
MRRYLKESSASPESIDQLSFADMMRDAAKAGLIKDPMRFRLYREKRNMTSHVYNQEKADEVLSVIDDFLADALQLKQELSKRASTPNT